MAGTVTNSLTLMAGAHLHKLHTTRSPREVRRVESGRPFIRPDCTLKKYPDRTAAIFGRSKLGHAPSVSRRDPDIWASLFSRHRYDWRRASPSLRRLRRKHRPRARRIREAVPIPHRASYGGGLNADTSRRLVSLRRYQLQRRQPPAVSVSALLLLDLPQERRWRRIHDQYHGGSRDPKSERQKRARGMECI